MKSNYKPIGEFIQLVDNRNSELKNLPLIGVTVNKKFIPSVANTVGTNMKNYKLIKKNQFACSLMQVRRDGKIPVALMEDEEAIISQAYPVFEIIDTNKLLPQYLMMWMSRSEFDREACFYAVGGVRGSLEWEDFCAMQLPVPSIEKQREMVKEYKTITDRIKLNEQLNKKLEETAQAIYKEWFVDFEFPNKDGKPYKSNGGEMVYCDELDMEIPVEWNYTELTKLSDITAGGDKPTNVTHVQSNNFNIPIYANSTEKEGLYGFTNQAKITKKAITISARGAIIGYTVLRLSPFVPIVRLIVIVPKKEELTNYLYETVKNFTFHNESSAQGQLTVPSISLYKILKPNSRTLKKFQNLTNVLINIKENHKFEIDYLKKFKAVLLSKMATIQD
ncbi:restriction endonuclease subunit S [Sulfurimonas indica]|uniref:restriction endonuclease subunit S n=1 Tax=Sulfurimonas indica TaxID=2508707 RepID=UPI0012655489|nr:restriction endonuclease subunit S [Sulfurimonas indica]